MTTESKTSENWIVIVARNARELLMQAMESAACQDIGNVHLLVVDNGSTDGTSECLRSPGWLRQCGLSGERLRVVSVFPQHGVANAWNQALSWLFGARGAQRVLVMNQDAWIRPDTYRWLCAYARDPVVSTGGPGFVTAVGVKEREQLGYPEITGGGAGRWPDPDPVAVRPHPDFSCYVITAKCWKKVGPFDEGFRGAYCEDSDYHCRMHKAGVSAISIGLPFLHIGGGAQTLKQATPWEAVAIQKQAELNRRYFVGKWGFEVGSKEYYDFFGSSAPNSSDRGITSTYKQDGWGSNYVLP